MVKQSELEKITSEAADSAYWYQYRRHMDWTENYTLYRDKVITNRITQRQSVNIPMMKYILKASMKAIDDPPALYFRSRSNNEDKEIKINTFWNRVVDDQKINVRDLVDKKQNILYGRTTSDWNIQNGKTIFDLKDTFDVYFDQFTDPTDIDGTFTYVDHRHIFLPLADVINDKRYDASARAKLKVWASSADGIARMGENSRSYIEKMLRSQIMGQINVANPKIGTPLVEAMKCWVRIFDDELGEDCIYYLVKVEGITLLCKRQEEVIGKTVDNFWRSHLLQTSWADDVERNDMYSDGTADMIRPTNKVVNAWFSQLVENRTMANLGMNYYNSNIEGFVPTTFEPVAWGWYGIPLSPGQKVQDVVANIPVPTLADSLPEIQLLMGIGEKAAFTPVTQLGMLSQQRVTLGEIEVIMQQSNDRLKMMRAYYIPAWQERGLKWIKLVEAQAHNLKSVKAYEKRNVKSSNGKMKSTMFSTEIDPSEFIDEDGYEIEVTNKTDQQAKSVNTIQTLQAVMGAMPGNTKLQEIYDRTLLTVVPDLTPEEIKEITDEQAKIHQTEQANGVPTAPVPGAGAAPTAPGATPLPGLGNATPNLKPPMPSQPPIQPAPGVVPPQPQPKSPVPQKALKQSIGQS
jgi:hypothetical protein